MILHKKPRVRRLCANAETHGCRILPQAVWIVPVIFVQSRALAAPGSGAALGILQVAEELTVRLDQQDVTAALEGILVGPQAAGEGVEFRILVEGVRVDAGGLRVPLTAEKLGIAVGVGLPRCRVSPR